VQGGPAQATKANTAACLCFCTIWPSFGRQPIGLFPYFTELLSRVPHTSSTGLVRLFKKCDEGRFNFYSPVSDRGRLTAFVEVHWARRVHSPMPKLSGPNLQETHLFATCKEEGCAVSTQETAALRKWEREHLTRLSAPWTDSHPHPRIANQLAEGNQYNANL
jgi:hypothetical protein